MFAWCGTIAGHHDRRFVGTRLFELVGRPDGIIEQLLVLSVGTEVGRQYAGLLRRLHDDRTRTIAKQHAGVAVAPVDEFRDALGADDERAFDLARLDEFIDRRQRVDKTCTGRFHADRRAGGNSEAMLHEGRDIGKNQVRGRRTYRYEVDVFGSNVRGCHRLLCRLDTHVRRRLVRRDGVPAFDTRARANPLVGRVDDLLQVEVRKNLLRQVTPGTGNLRVNHSDTREWPVAMIVESVMRLPVAADCLSAAAPHFELPQSPCQSHAGMRSYRHCRGF
jgi:hypothetical protein